MECNCIKELEEKLQGAYEDPEGYLDTVFSIERLQYSPVVRYYTRLKKKDGTLKKKKEQVAILPAYCPWCGTKVRDSKPEESGG